jgi:hypothetical protein
MRENGRVPVRAEQQSVRTETRRGFQKHLGMIGVTCFGLLFTPAFYTFIRKLGRKE